jgi:hypothetical protein
MTRIHWLVPCGALAALLLVRCGGDGSNVNLDGGKKGDSGVSPMGGDSGVIGDDSGGSDGEVPTGDGSTVVPTGDAANPDAGGGGPPPIPVPDGGSKSDPGSVTCGGAPCDVSKGNFCCVEAADGGGSGSGKETCEPPNSVCNGLSRKCNEASDCNGGVCCQAIVGIALPGSTSCESSCPNAFQTCRTDGECGGDSDAAALKRCVPQICTNANPPRSLTIEACAVPPGPGNANGGAGTLAYCAPLP